MSLRTLAHIHTIAFGFLSSVSTNHYIICKYNIMDYNYRHFKMLSPYIFIIYFTSYIFNKRKMVALFTPLLWYISIVGIIILIYRRIYNETILYSLIFYKLFNIKTDIPAFLLKILTIIFLYNKRTHITKYSIGFTLIVLTGYIYFVDTDEVYMSKF